MKIFKYTLLFLMIFTLIPPISVEAETLKDYQNLLQKYKDEQAAKKDEINKTESQIRANKAEIDKTTKEMKQMQAEIVKMQLDIVEFNEEIKKKTIESKQLFEYLQLTKGENAYLEYAFGAETMTDFIYRMSIVEQLTQYNEETINSLEQMIKKNEEKEEAYNKREKEIGTRQKELNDKIAKLSGLKNTLSDTEITVAQQVKIYQAEVDSYIKQGCKPNDVIGKDCATSSVAAGFFRPTTKGYVTSEFGYRWGTLHRGLDISNTNPYSTKIYPVAAGKVTKKYEDYYGALVLIIEHQTIDKKYYSSMYVHLNSYAPGIEVGTNVTSNTFIGYMGNTGYSFGPHLHLEIAQCRIYNLADKNCKSWDGYINFMANQSKNGYKGPRQLINFPKSGITYNGR